MSAAERRKIVLEAIVQDYVATREPVGSKAVVERHNLGVSPATVRNDMAQLEDAGLITQPHTSAGRIPTDAGYREFVDSIAQMKPLTPAQRAAIENILNEAVDLDDVLDRSVRLLAHLTNQVAVVQYPSLRRTALRHVELVLRGDHHVLIIIITDAGRVEQRTIRFERKILDAQIERLGNEINRHCIGKDLAELAAGFDSIAAKLPLELTELHTRIAQVLTETLSTDAEERVVVAGTANLTRYDVDFVSSISPVLDALEEQVVLLRLLAYREEGLRVSIGKENAAAGLGETSVVSATYDGAASSPVARLGVLGPTRMDYPATMGSVYAVAKYLSLVLGNTQ
ncbi:MAG: heat-inducible transcriptional repressor HrcA [Trueperella sp.]|nr:heat-inducible transcriptional repressor HrcA [Trueperella sp.]